VHSSIFLWVEQHTKLQTWGHRETVFLESYNAISIISVLNSTRLQQKMWNFEFNRDKYNLHHQKACEKLYKRLLNSFFILQMVIAVN
jgi:hypothetical protein